MGDATTESQRAAAAVREEARPLLAPADFDGVGDWAAGASLVLLGEATHGTREFYEARAAITRCLIERHGFNGVAIEGDWPDAYRVNCYVRGVGPRIAGPVEALSGFRRFPAWMWRNRSVVDFLRWLRAYNQVLPPEERAGFYGMDLYSLHASMQAVVDYLAERDPSAAEAARESYACFENYDTDFEGYAWAARQLEEGPCEEAVANQLLALHRRRAELMTRDGRSAGEDFFDAEQNARLARNAERYYRSMLTGRSASWNIRDEHMAETLARLRIHLSRDGHDAKLVVWAHNSHLGDARATEMCESGELNVGQLMREREGAVVRAIGFTTHTGTVMAASNWGGPPKVKRVRPSLSGSYEDVFHSTGLPRFFLPLVPGQRAHRWLDHPRLERAIGVIYRPETERWSHYFEARLASQFHAIIHVDETQAVEALDREAVQVEAEMPETFPTGI